jgi:diguanylate cyclase (GGDEF)-like protein
MIVPRSVLVGLSPIPPRHRHNRRCGAIGRKVVVSAPSAAPAKEPRLDPLSTPGDSLALLARLNAALPLVDQERRPLSLLQLDIDRCGERNRSRGKASDDVLQKLTELLRAVVTPEEGADDDQSTAEAFRIGPDEFVLLQPRMGRLRARRFAAALLTDAGKECIPLRIGIGVAEPGAIDLGQLLLAADGALRAVRARGGRRARLLTRAPEDAAGAGGVVEWLARHSIGTAQQLDEAYHLALTDPLTELPNQRALDQFLDSEVPRAERHGRPFAILLIDGDNLKTYNEQYGYPAGDAWIKTLGSLLADQTRGSDLTVRWRVGDEFIIAMPETSRDAALQAAERIRLAVESASAQLPIPATISIGVAAYPDDGTTRETLLNRAEAANARAKSRGKNQIALIEEPPDEPEDDAPDERQSE